MKTSCAMEGADVAAPVRSAAALSLGSHTPQRHGRFGAG